MVPVLWNLNLWIAQKYLSKILVASNEPKGFTRTSKNSRTSPGASSSVKHNGSFQVRPCCESCVNMLDLTVLTKFINKIKKTNCHRNTNYILIFLLFNILSNFKTKRVFPVPIVAAFIILLHYEGIDKFRFYLYFFFLIWYSTSDLGYWVFILIARSLPLYLNIMPHKLIWLPHAQQGKVPISRVDFCIVISDIYENRFLLNGRYFKKTTTNNVYLQTLSMQQKLTLPLLSSEELGCKTLMVPPITGAKEDC